MRRINILLPSILLFYLSSCGVPPQLHYPETRKDTNIIDDYFGTQVTDPYRWLEDDNSEETAAWVKAQNEVTFDYLENIPFREKIKERLTEIWDYEKVSAPFIVADKYYYYKNDGLQNQSVLFSADELGGDETIIIDPNTFSEDGTVALSGTYFRKDGRYMGYSKSVSGSDWREFFIRDLTTKKDLKDHLTWIKFSGMSWAGDGFYYSRFPTPSEEDVLDASNENSKIYYHALGTDQSDDVLIFEDSANPKISNYAGVTYDEQYLVLYRTKGTHGNSLAVKPLNKPESAFIDIIPDFVDEHFVIGTRGANLLVVTNRDAKNLRLVEIDPNHPEKENWKDIIAESDHVLRSVSEVGGKLLVSYLEDVSSHLYTYSFNGERLSEVGLPTMGSAGGFGGKPDDKEVFFNFSSFAYPPTVFRYDVKTGKSELYKQAEINIDFDAFETNQIFYPSKDGTMIPMFITHKKGLKMDGSAPTLLYGYGGFNISRTPGFSISRMVLLGAGGIFVNANIRGGSEYGEAWHEGGRLHNKQNVFDDFIAAADYLVENNYTRREKLAVSGRSNGGLLIGAVINQRPDLSAVAFPAVGVMDMLRYHKFTIGWAWAVEYGSSDEEEHFSNLYGYSPLHNIIENGNYPATMVTTADHDDRVVPAHSFKYAAELQDKNRHNPNPLLIRIETKAGHGAGMPTSKRIEGAADFWSFMFYNTNTDY